MKNQAYFIILLLFSACKGLNNTEKNLTHQKIISQIEQSLNQWHQAAADADFKTYFDLMTPDAVFVGTDASEVWSKKDFMTFAKPYFEQGKAWDFKKINRHIYLDDQHPDFAWFDETLHTWMGVCRGSGVMVYKDKDWRIRHYVLSMTVPNAKIKQVMHIIK